MRLKRQTFAWAFYDWANSAFAVVVLTGFFPIFFREFWAAEQPTQQITFYLGLANSLSSLVIVLLAPILGAIADQGGIKKRLLMTFAVLGMTMTASLFWVGEGQWGLAIAFFFIASIGWMGGNVFYDALLVDVAERPQLDRVSALGFSLGYLGSGLMFAFCVTMSLHPTWFGLNDASQAVRLSFLLTALWWLVFSLPIWLFVKEPASKKKFPFSQSVKRGFSQLWQTFHEIRSLRPVFMFLLAYWLYIDGVDTVIRMAVDYGKALGFDNNGLITALLITQFVGFPAALAYGWLGSKIGAKRGILLGIGAYCIITIWASQMTQTWEFYGLAIFVGLVQGGIQALSRSCYARMIPKEKAAEFFGFYNMLGKFAAVIGPVMVGWIGAVSQNPRAGILSILVLFILGAAVLIMTPVSQVQEKTHN